MAIIVQVILVGISVAFLPSYASPTNWFYNIPRALFGLASSASASASAQAAPSSYIADLRKRQEKTEELQNGKDLTEQADLLDANNDKEKSSDNGEGGTEENNEVSPSLLEKKVGKILSKLRLIAQIKNAYHYRPEIHEHESNITFNITSVNHNQNLTAGEMQKEDIKEVPNIDPRFAPNIQPEKVDPIEPAIAYGVPKKPIVLSKEQIENSPLRIELDVNQVNNKLEDFNSPKKEKLIEHEPGKFGTVGIFFAELLGSIVGLTYGALAQFTSGGQNPVTISTSEGL